MTERNKKIKKNLLLAVLLLAFLPLGACGVSERLSAIGKAPVMTDIQNPNARNGYHPVELPMPAQVAETSQPNSLWEASRQTFFKDQRAHKVGDILTILVDISDEADFKNKTERKRDGDESLGVSNLLGLENIPKKFLPSGYDPANAVGLTSTTDTTGDGKIKREEDVKLKLAAMVTQVLPNGNFVIRGTQEVRVNFELRELTIDGVIRPEDILNNNSISYEKIAEARISYGGRGQVTDIQQPRYGHQFVEAVLPF